RVAAGVADPGAARRLRRPHLSGHRSRRDVSYAMAMKRQKGSLESLAEGLRAYALSYPETFEEAPWGDRVVKVRGKIFFFCGVHEGRLYVTAKLPKTGREVLKRANAEPTHYGMGKHGWVTSKFAREEEVAEAEVMQWIDESF